MIQGAPLDVLEGGGFENQLLRPTPAHGSQLLAEGWSDLLDPWMLMDMGLVLLMALLLGAMIAYHPSVRGRVSSLEHFEQPKTFLMYAMVAAVVALIVKVEPTMALVVFGIGGLLRFRTMVGEAKDTGRVILVTVVGLCCGLKIFIVAIPATVIGWLVIYGLERQVAGIIRISGVLDEHIQDSTQAHRELINACRCSIIGEQTKFIKREFSFVIKADASFDRESLQSKFDSLPAELRGNVDWDRL